MGSWRKAQEFQLVKGRFLSLQLGSIPGASPGAGELRVGLAGEAQVEEQSQDYFRSLFIHFPCLWIEWPLYSNSFLVDFFQGERCVCWKV